MKRVRPISITVIGWLFIAVGSAGLVSGARPLFDHALGRALADLDRHEAIDMVLATTSGLLSILGGGFLFRGRNWARWLLVVWMGFHLILSAEHSLSKLLVHCVLFVPILYLLFRPRASAFFSGRGIGTGGDRENRESN